MERTSRANTRPKSGLIVSILCIAGLASLAKGAQAFAEYKSPAQAFMREYTGDEDCLDNTPYDPHQGAWIETGDVEGNLILAAIPRPGSDNTPSMLSFSIETHTFSAPKFTPSDQRTAAYLLEASCPGISEGS